MLARLIFNRGINELSAFQIAQLAAAAAELAGGGNTSLLGSLRAATGLDDLDVVTDSEGNAAVRAGRYIQDNIYLGVEAGERGSTRGHDQSRHHRESEGARRGRHGWRFQPRRLLREGLLTAAARVRWHDRLPRLALSGLRQCLNLICWQDSCESFRR